jgi:predicted AAA+ superfamily ATPase
MYVLVEFEHDCILEEVVELVASKPGMYMDYNSLSRQYKKDRRVIKNYFLYLRESYLIRLIGNYRKGVDSSFRKPNKTYSSDIAISHLYRKYRERFVYRTNDRDWDNQLQRDRPILEE